MSHPANPKKIAEDGLNLIKDYEGLRLEAYLCPAMVWTIGYGTTAGVQRGMKIDKATADKWLVRDVEMAAAAVRRAVSVKIKQNQFDAMVSLAYNIGIRGFKSSTVLRKLNEANDWEAGQAFLMWCKITVNGKKVESVGLLRRRKAERDLFFKHLTKKAIEAAKKPPRA